MNRPDPVERLARASQAHVDRTGVPVADRIEQANDLAAAGKLSTAARLLRVHLRDNPGDEALRRALVELYRDSGHPDQAGRYGVSLAGVTPAERNAYARLLVAQNADDERIRSLSVLANGAPIPDRLVADMAEAARANQASAPWEVVAGIGFGTSFLLAIVAGVVVYVLALIDAEAVSLVARIGVAATVAGIVVGLLGLGGSAVVERRRRAAI